MIQITRMITALGSCRFSTVLTALFILNASRGYCANSPEFRNRGRNTPGPTLDKFLPDSPSSYNSNVPEEKYLTLDINVERPDPYEASEEQSYQPFQKPVYQLRPQQTYQQRPQQAYQVPQQNYRPVRQDAPQTRTIQKWFRSHSLTDSSGQVVTQQQPFQPQQYQPINRPVRQQQHFPPQQFQPFYPQARNSRIVKWYRSNSLTDYRGTVTTLWFYQNTGKSYTFAIRGPLPAPENEMISWIERNSPNYQLTDIPYVPYGGDTSQSPNPAPQQPQYRPQPQQPSRPQPQPEYRPQPQPEYRPPPQPEYRPPPQPEYQPPPQPEYRPPPSRPSRPHTSISITIGSPWDGKMPESCGKIWVKIEDKVVGGKDTLIQRNPWQVAIVRRDSMELLCGGTLITNRHVVTAAHCFFRQGKGGKSEPLTKKDVRILAGYTDIQPENKQFHEVQDLHVHSKYAQEHRRNDVSVIFLKDSLEFTATITPICLPKMKTADYKAGRSCRITGWGTTGDGFGRAKVLQSLDLPLTTDEQCKSQNERHNNISKGMFCAGDYFSGGKDSCQGDSGGPLACYDKNAYYLYGITSWGYGCGQQYYPGVYTKVTAYRSWIEHMLNVTKSNLNRDSFMEAEPEPDYDEPEPPALAETDDENWEEDIM